MDTAEDGKYALLHARCEARAGRLAAALKALDKAATAAAEVGCRGALSASLLYLCSKLQCCVSVKALGIWEQAGHKSGSEPLELFSRKKTHAMMRMMRRTRTGRR